MGTIIGFVVGIGIVSGAWDGSLQFWGVGAFVVAVIVGTFLMPTTIGTFMVSIQICSIIAVIAGLVQGHSHSSLIALAFAGAATITQMIIGAVHRDRI